MRPPKTPVTPLSINKTPVYTFEQLHEFADESVKYERHALVQMCEEVMARCNARDNAMGYVIAEEISNKISERE